MICNSIVGVVIIIVVINVIIVVVIVVINVIIVVVIVGVLVLDVFWRAQVSFEFQRLGAVLDME